MSITTDLLTRWKLARNITSDNAAAKALGITRGAVSNYRTGVSHADASVLIRMATDLGQDPTGYVLAVQAERTTALKTKTALRKLAEKFPPFAAALLLWLCNANSAHSHTITNVYFDINDTEYTYATIKQLAREMLAALLRGIWRLGTWTFRHAAPLVA